MDTVCQSPRLLQQACLFIFLTIGQPGLSFGQSGPIGQFEDHQDVGNPKLSGSAMYNATDQTYLLSGAGKNIWTNVDQFQFVWKKIMLWGKL